MREFGLLKLLTASLLLYSTVMCVLEIQQTRALPELERHTIVSAGPMGVQFDSQEIESPDSESRALDYSQPKTQELNSSVAATSVSSRDENSAEQFTLRLHELESDASQPFDVNLSNRDLALRAVST